MSTSRPAAVPLQIPVGNHLLAAMTRTERELVLQLVEHGVIEPQGSAPQSWVFGGSSLQRTRVALRLLRDLELNLPGAALAVDLLDEIARLRRDLQAAAGHRTP